MSQLIQLSSLNDLNELNSLNRGINSKIAKLEKP